MATSHSMFSLWLTLGLVSLQIINGGCQLSSGQRHNLIGVRQNPDSVIAVKNKSFLMNCTVSDKNLLTQTITWWKDGESISDTRRTVSSNGSLYFKKIIHKPVRKRTDEGIYQCFAKDQFGTLSGSPVKLIVAEIPRFDEQEGPQDVSAQVGENVRFSCGTSAVSPYFIWEKNHEHLPQDDRMSLFEETGVLLIRNVQVADQGRYRCKVVNVAGTRSSREAQLTVTGDQRNLPSYLLSSPKSVVRSVGESAVFECVPGGWPVHEVTWSRQDGRTIAGTRYSIIGKTSLRIDNIQLSDNGTYVCTLSDPSKKTSATLFVQSPPSIIRPPKSKQVQGFSTVRLMCSAVGIPQPIITWYMNGQPVHKEYVKYDEQSNMSTLVLVRPKISGYYQCRAQNSAGIDQATAKISVRSSPNAPDPPTGLKAVAMSSTIIRLSWKPSPPKNNIETLAYVVYYKQQESTKELEKVETNNFALFENLKPYTNYTFYVISFNSRGASFNRSEVVSAATAEGVPIGAPVVIVKTLSATSIRVRWTELPLEVARGIVIRFSIIYREHGRSSERVKTVDSAVRDYTLTGLKPGTLYYVRVGAATKAGFSVLKDEIWPWTPAKTLPGGLVDVPSPPSLWLEAANETALLVSWKPSAYDDLPVTAYLLKYRRNDKVEEDGIKQIMLGAEVHRFIIQDLQPLSWYEISVLALNENGEGGDAMETIEMKPGSFAGMDASNDLAPPPIDIEAEPFNETSVRVEWKPPAGVSGVVNYTIRYRPIHQETDMKFVKSEKQEVIVSGLKPFTSYSFAVQANSSNVAGRFSSEVICRTREGVPSAPQNVYVKLLTPSSAELSWSPPANKNGIIVSYVIHYTRDNSGSEMPPMQWAVRTENGSVTVAKFRNLKENHIYNFKIQAATHAGLGAETNILQIRTEQGSTDLAGTTGPTTLSDVDVQTLGIVAGVVTVLLCAVCIIVIKWHRRSIRTRLVEGSQPERLANWEVTVDSNGSSHVTRVPLSQEMDTFIPMLTQNNDSRSSGYVSMQHMNGVIESGHPLLDRYTPQQAADRRRLHSSDRDLHMRVREGCEEERRGSLKTNPSLPDNDDSQSPLLYANSNHTSSFNTLESALGTSQPPTSESSIQESTESPQEEGNYPSTSMPVMSPYSSSSCKSEDTDHMPPAQMHSGINATSCNSSKNSEQGDETLSHSTSVNEDEACLSLLYTSSVSPGDNASEPTSSLHSSHTSLCQSRTQGCKCKLTSAPQISQQNQVQNAE